jgi:hypothetical protein
MDVARHAWKQLDEALAAAKPDDWALYHTAAHFAFQEKTRLDEAMTWNEKSLAIKQSFWNNETKARLLDHAGRTKDAIPYLEKAKELAKGVAPQGYLDGLDKTLAEWRGKLEKR